MEDSSFKHLKSKNFNATSFITFCNTSLDTFLIRKVSGKKGPTYLNNHWLTFVSSFYDPTEPSFAHRIRVPEQFFINQQFTSAKRMNVSYHKVTFSILFVLVLENRLIFIFTSWPQKCLEEKQLMVAHSYIPERLNSMILKWAKMIGNDLRQCLNNDRITGPIVPKK